MSENKRFKSFRNELTESEYKEVLTGYPNRGIDNDVGPVKFDQSMLMKVNAVLNALNRYSYQHPNEAFIKIKTRLNVFMLDFPWTPYLWNDGGMGNVALTVTRYGRVDGVDAITGEIRVDGKANNPDGFMEFTLSVQMEVGEDGLYRMTAKLMPKADVLPESVEQVDESGKLYTHLHHPKGPAVVNKKGKTVKVHKTETAARKHAMKEEAEQIDELSKKTKDAYVAKRGSQLSSMLSGHTRGKQLTGKQQANAVKGIKQATGVKEEAELDEELTPARQAVIDREKKKASKTIMRGKTAAERDRAYARGSRINYLELVHKYGKKSDKTGSPYQVDKRNLDKWRKAEHGMREEVEPIEEMLKAGDKVKVPHKGKMVRGRIVRHDNGGSGKAQQHGGGYVVDVGEHGSITVPSHKVVKEAAEQIDELSAKTKRSYYDKSVRSSNKMRDELDSVRDEQEHKAQDFARSSEGQISVDSARANVRHIDGGEKLVAREAELKKKIKQRERGQQQAKKTVKEGLIGGQKRLDVNKNKRLDSQDFAMLRAKKKPVKEYLDMASGMALQAPAPGDAVADKSGKGKRFHKKAVKMAEAAMAKARKPKQKTPQKSDRSGAANVIGRQSAIKHTLAKHDMRW
jgi:hypothetical protein